MRFSIGIPRTLFRFLERAWVDPFGQSKHRSRALSGIIIQYLDPFPRCVIVRDSHKATSRSRLRLSLRGRRSGRNSTHSLLARKLTYATNRQQTVPSEKQYLCLSSNTNNQCCNAALSFLELQFSCQQKYFAHTPLFVLNLSDHDRNLTQICRFNFQSKMQSGLYLNRCHLFCLYRPGSRCFMHHAIGDDKSPSHRGCRDGP